MDLIHGDCLEELKKLGDKSVDFVYLDLPYGQTACKWDVKLDLKALWVELRRVAKSDRTGFFFSCTTKFGFELFNNSPKGWFRWDLVWKKNRAAGFLNAYRLPMRKHEMVYCFAKKSPAYDVSSHTEVLREKNSTDFPTKDVYGTKKNIIGKIHKEPLPTSDVTPPSEEHELVYCFAKKSPAYDVSSHTEFVDIKHNRNTPKNEIYGESKITEKDKVSRYYKVPLPTSDISQEEEPPSSWCDYKLDNKVGHRTAKPVKLMEFLLKYWTKEGDVVLDPTMGSGSMGVACKNMNRLFIGMEKDEEIYNLAFGRLVD